MKKLIIILLSALFTLCLYTPVFANDIKIIDDENVLSNEEKDDLYNLIYEYIDHTNYDMVLYLANKGDEYYKYNTITDLADDTFDYNGYGIGDNREGIIICFDIYYRDYTITTSGPLCIGTYSNSALDSVYNRVTPCFKEDDFYNGLKTFIEQATYTYDNYSYYHDYQEEPTKQDRLINTAIFSIIGSLLITLVYFLVNNFKLKSKHKKLTAEQYIKDANINIFNSGDIYLYKSVSRTKIQKSNNTSGSSSSTHISHSGSIHGGGGSHRV